MTNTLLVVDLEIAERILDDSLSAASPEHGAAWEMLLLLQGRSGPTGFFLRSAADHGISLEPHRLTD